jgi:hypothetical protein
MRQWSITIVIGLTFFTAGCASLCHLPRCSQEEGPATLLAWEVGPKKRDKDADDAHPPGEKKDGNSAKKNGNGREEKNDDTSKQDGKLDGEPEESKEPKELAADRPDFTEASTTVGLGRIQLESGYTYSRNQKAGLSSAHSFPEALLRVGLFAEWFELRLGQNYSTLRGVEPDGSPLRTAGFEDLYVGTKLALTEQKGYLPEVAVILFATLPTGRASLTADRVLPGMSYQYGWDLIKDRLSFAASSIIASAVDDAGHGYLELAQSASFGYTLSERLGAYTEVYAFFPHGALASGVTPQYYFDGGFTYKVTPDVQYDVRAGVGLNRHADDYFLGTGFVVRY